ncbi:MAG: type II toxin-antitoxin system Phd/YefM family antitoxin [Angustibacter sp.]
MQVGVRDLKARLSEYLARAAQGESVEVVSHGRPVARLVPPTRRDTIQDGLAAGWLTRVEDRPPRDVRPAAPRAGTTSTQALRADRDA